MHDAKKYCSDNKLPEVFDEVMYEIESTKAVAARDVRAVMSCLEEMSCKVSQSFLHDTLVTMLITCVGRSCGKCHQCKSASEQITRTASNLLSLTSCSAANKQ